MESKTVFGAILAQRHLTGRRVSEALGVSNQAVTLWRKGLCRIGAERAISMETQLGIPRHVLRPDLWPPPEPFAMPAVKPAKPARKTRSRIDAATDLAPPPRERRPKRRSPGKPPAG